MHASVKKWSLNLVKVAIAVLGLGWVIAHTPWNDQATIRAGAELYGMTLREPVEVTVLEEGRINVPATAIRVRFPDKAVKMADADGKVLTQPLTRPDNASHEDTIPRDRLVMVEGEKNEPKIQIGLRNLVRKANPWLLVGSWSLLVIPFLVSAWRWRKLMEPQGIFLPFKKCLALTFVGQFYSTFLPGITGGDLVKIIYTSRVIGSKTKSTITILLDRVIGLIALIVIAGIAAACQAGHDPTMLKVALAVGAVLLGLAVGSVAYFSHRLREMTGLAALLRHPSMPEFVRKADEVLHAYRGAWQVLTEAFIASLITQIVIPVSAWMAGRAFGIDAHPGYYFAFVPLALLAASVPISPPQGFGVTEWILFSLFHKGGLSTASQSFALAQAIRFLPVMWNLVGAFWVVTGTYSRHQAIEEDAAAAKEAATPARG